MRIHIVSNVFDYLKCVHIRPDDDQNCRRNMQHSYIGKI
jgi:hypothetical protein